MNVLIVLNNLRVANGVATTIMNQYDALVEQGYKVDFMQFLRFESPYVERIEKNGGKIILVQKDHRDLHQMIQVLKNTRYDIVHINQMNAQTVKLAAIAHFFGVRCVIVHSHNTKIPANWKRTVLEAMCNLAYRLFADQRLACSESAGRDAFGKQPFLVLKNAIDVSKFRFNADQRNRIRGELGISSDTFVVGTVCRYARQKSPIFMIDIMNEVIKKRPGSLFLWVGSAPRDDDPIYLQMKQRVKELHLENAMCWVGSKTDVHHWYSAMDVFMMPSLWEGLGITFVEAQANSLPTLASDVVPRDTQITPLISYHSLSASPAVWADAILKYDVRTEVSGRDYSQQFLEAGYDLKTACSDLAKIYRHCLDRQ